MATVVAVPGGASNRSGTGAPRFELPERAIACSMVAPASLSSAAHPASQRAIETLGDVSNALEQLRTRQFPANCTGARYLLVEDDLDSAGLGWTAKMWSSVLEIARRQDRVLLEVPLNSSWRHAKRAHRAWHKRSNVADPGGRRPRWCDRPPWTLQCFYQPWTACPLPDASTSVYKPGVEADMHLLKVFKSRRYQLATHVQLKLSWIATSQSTWGSALQLKGLRGVQRSSQFAANRIAEMVATFNAAIHLLFRPRPWVERLIQCVTETVRPQGRPLGHIIAVHIRASAEKEAEIQERQGVTLPSVANYFVLARSFAMQLEQPRLLLQTSSASALREFTKRADDHRLEVYFTNNTRSEHDNWGGWSPSGQTESTIVGAVNLHVASASADIFISLKMSAWTPLVAARGWEGGERHAVCCAPTPSALAWWRACRKTPTLYVYVRRSVRLNITEALALGPASQRRCLLWSRYHSLPELQRHGPWTQNTPPV